MYLTQSDSSKQFELSDIALSKRHFNRRQERILIEIETESLISNQAWANLEKFYANPENTDNYLCKICAYI